MRPDEALRVLGVAASATPQEIKLAYRRMVKAWHPDRHGADEGRRARAEEALKQVIAAYQCVRGGVPPPEPQDARQGKSETSASMFSIHPTAPPPGRSRAQSHPTRTDRGRRRKRESAVGGLLAIATLGVFVSLAAWSMATPELERCRAWVGAKLHTIPRFTKGATLVFRVDDFSPRLSELDDDRTLEVVCRR